MLHVARATKPRLVISWRRFPQSHREGPGRRSSTGPPKSVWALRRQRLSPDCLSRQTAAATPAPSSKISCEQLPPAGSRAKLGCDSYASRHAREVTIMDPEIIHIPEMAMLLGRSESAIRSALQAQAAWLPPSFKQGRRICWRLEMVRDFLKEWEETGGQKSKPGRKRKPAPTLTSVRQQLELGRSV